jgi:pimeloyl-ACP methyl ester carboxylesterase
MRLRNFVLAFLVALATPVAAEVRIGTLDPVATDAAIVLAKQPHRWFVDDAAEARGELLVYLPGTAADTSGQDELGTLAASLGYDVLFLMYPNDVAAATCQDDPDATSFERFRREIVSGGDRHDAVRIARADSIENRLLRAIAALARADRARWSRYLDGERIAWERLALAGHSQGGGHALLMARDHAVARVVLLGAPKDYSRAHDAPAAWYGAGATPASRIFALVHAQDDQAIDHGQQLANLRAAGLTGIADEDERAFAPGTHVIVTNAPGREVGSAMAHLGLAFDFMLPRRDGNNLHRAAWTWLLSGSSG